jgi:hypothetical protein
LTGCWGGGEIRMPIQTARILPRADGRHLAHFCGCKATMDCKGNIVGGLRKC